MNSDRRVKLSLMLFGACGILFGFLLGASSSQEAKRESLQSENGRYQLVETSSIRIILDTGTAERWELRFNNGRDGWEKVGPPWAEDK
jgi:hypothetical protein